MKYPDDLELSISNILKELGLDLKQEHLKNTPKRVAKYLKAYENKEIKLDSIPTLFNTNGYDEIVILKDIDFHSLCAHHMLGITGRAHLGYIPDRHIIGISKLARLVDIFAERLQVQEELTKSIADSLAQILHPKGLGVVIEAAHQCVRSRGVMKQNAVMITSAMRGKFRTSQAARNEFMRLIDK